MASYFVQAIKCKFLPHGTDAMKPRCLSEMIKGTKSGPHLLVCNLSIKSISRNEVEMMPVGGRLNFKEEDRHNIHFDNIDNRVNSSSWHTSTKKGVLWADSKRAFGGSEAHFGEDLVEHPIVGVSDGGRVVRDASEFVEYMLWQHKKLRM